LRIRAFTDNPTGIALEFGLSVEFPEPRTDRPEHCSISPVFTLEIEWFSESEIEEELSKLLSLYRAFYPEPDPTDGEIMRDPERARRARQTFKVVVEHQLNSAESEGFLLHEEEENVLNVFIASVREIKLSEDICDKGFDDMVECLNRLNDLTTAPFIRRIL